MSWSVMYIGKAENVAQALKDNSIKLSGASKEEYDAALPHLVGLVEQNYNKPNNPVIQINASGSGHNDYRSCMVSIQNLGGQLV